MRRGNRSKYIVLSKEQQLLLEKVYRTDPYLSIAEKKKLSMELKIERKKVVRWFSHRRFKEKRDSGKNVIMSLFFLVHM